MASSEDTALWKDLANQARALEETLHALERQSKFSDPHDRADAIVTLHAGAGGTESCDWVEMLVRMYRRWAERKGYGVEVTDLLSGDQAGLKSITFLLRGPFAYGHLKGEIGVHRLVRISPFDANQRRHTSFASCDVLPDLENEIVIDLQDKDLRIDTFRASGHGGQHVNKTDSAVRITHRPTGLVVTCQNERSQHKNKQKALKILKARLYALEQEKKRKAMERHYDEKGEIAWGNQIRSYVFMPYQLVKDHRTGLEAGNIERVMDGDLDPFIDAYLENRLK